MLAQPIEPAPLLWVLGSLCQLYRIPFDARLILQRFRAALHAGDLGRSRRGAGLQVGEWRPVTEFAQVSLPSVALVKAPLPGQAANDADDAPGPAMPALILKSDGTRFLYFRAGSESGETALGDRVRRAVRGHGAARGTRAAGGQRAGC